MRATQDPAKVRRIMEAAVHNFAQAGFQATKTQAIAMDANVSKGLVFHYFGDKQSLYLATFQYAVDKLTKAADLSVWQEASDFKAMIVHALQYKIQLQLRYPDEFTLCLAAYAGEALPAELKKRLTTVWGETMQSDISMLLDPLIARMHLRRGVSPVTVKTFATMLSNYVYDRTQTVLRGQKHIQVADLDWVVDEALALIEMAEGGYSAHRARDDMQ